MGSGEKICRGDTEKNKTLPLINADQVKDRVIAPSVPRACAVKDAERVPGLDQVGGHGRTHVAQTDECDVHGRPRLNKCIIENGCEWGGGGCGDSVLDEEISLAN